MVEWRILAGCFALSWLRAFSSRTILNMSTAGLSDTGPCGPVSPALHENKHKTRSMEAHTHTSTLTHNLTLLATRLTYLRFARAHLRSVDLKLFLQKATPNGPSTNTYVSLPVVLAKRVRFMKDTYPVSSEDIVLSIPCWNFLINVWENP